MRAWIATWIGFLARLQVFLGFTKLRLQGEELVINKYLGSH